MNEKYIINAAGQIEPANYNELVWHYVDKTTTPYGVAPRLHIRVETWYRVGDDIFLTRTRAEWAADDVEVMTGTRPAIEEGERYEGWTWGYLGRYPGIINVFDTQEEADEWLFDCAQNDFADNSDSPQTFNTRSDAEAWLQENNKDGYE